MKERLLPFSKKIIFSLMYNLSISRNKLLKNFTYFFDPIPESSYTINNTFPQSMYIYQYMHISFERQPPNTRFNTLRDTHF